MNICQRNIQYALLIMILQGIKSKYFTLLLTFMYLILLFGFVLILKDKS